MEHDARSVANELIRRAHDAGRDITPMQVVKLAYYCHAWMLGLYHRPLLEQPIEAWRYGLVVPEIYRSLRRYGGELYADPSIWNPPGLRNALTTPTRPTSSTRYQKNTAIFQVSGCLR